MAKRGDRRLTAIEVEGFKSAGAPVRLEVRDITVLAGANSAGKSAVMQPLLLIKQTIEKRYDPGGLAIDGPLVRFSDADQFLSTLTTGQDHSRFQIQIDCGEWSERLIFGRDLGQRLGPQKMRFGDRGGKFEWALGDILRPDDPSLRSNLGNPLLHAMYGRAGEDGRQFIISRAGPMLAAELRLPGQDSPIVSFAAGREMAAVAVDLIYLPGLRGNPERQYTVTAGGPQFTGSFNDYVATVVHAWSIGSDDRTAVLGAQLRHLGLTSFATTRAVDDTRVEVHVSRLLKPRRAKSRDTVNIADVGFGVSQTLPVLVALLAAARNQPVYIEQPELHLHPRAQVGLAEILVEAANRGVQVIIETHSSLLILALQAAVAAGDITPERLSLNWFTRDAKGQTHVARADLHADGTYGDWPIDFDDVEFGLQHRYMTLAEQLRAKKSS